jgi:hypothetical protein
LKVNFGLGPSGVWAGPGKILKFQPMQTSIPLIPEPYLGVYRMNPEMSGMEFCNKITKKYFAMKKPTLLPAEQLVYLSTAFSHPQK